jgi:hypothetical protein
MGSNAEDGDLSAARCGIGQGKKAAVVDQRELGLQAFIAAAVARYAEEPLVVDFLNGSGADSSAEAPADARPVTTPADTERKEKAAEPKTGLVELVLDDCD